ncbi:MAG TPA: hypothetical protein VFV63_17470 [Ilumatobacteraceae bacterium]|nr:hypothetical protein [Ilumatobacteraceae bacterium]
MKRRSVRVVTALALVIGSGVTSIALSSPPGAAAPASLGSGGEYHALAPQRVLDTRSAINDPVLPGPKALIPGAGEAFEVQLLGQGGLPAVAAAANVLAVAVNITVVSPSEQGYLRVFGKGANEGDSSLVNFQAGQNVPNMAIVRPGAEGKIAIRLISEGGAGTAHVLIDVFGWFSTSSYGTRGARLMPVGPGRVYDSRSPLFGADPVTALEVVTVPIRGADSLNPAVTDIVPNSPSVVGALVNVTGVNNRPGSQPTFVSVVPETPVGGQWPTTSNLNLRAGQIKPNLVLVPVGADGSIRLFNEQGSVDLVVDIVGYLVNGAAVDTAAGRVVPLTSPFRVLDTRQPAFGSVSLAPGKAEDWSFKEFVNDVRIGGVPVGNQSALLGNFTATALERPADWFTPVDTFMTAFPMPVGAAGPPPEASNLNLVENESVPNMALLKYGGDATDPYRVRVYNYNGFVHYLVDVSAVVLAD